MRFVPDCRLQRNAHHILAGFLPLKCACHNALFQQIGYGENRKRPFSGTHCVEIQHRRLHVDREHTHLAPEQRFRNTAFRPKYAGGQHASHPGGDVVFPADCGRAAQQVKIRNRRETPWHFEMVSIV
ncbi:hypothetical protein SDC9_157538 [bioreactor metagenome]|uniref:Uncharacterized protein n=1 Tax=bioreactor metagenome TaxID=1076179 RepID=A0A645FD00_9ZZZZ